MYFATSRELYVCVASGAKPRFNIVKSGLLMKMKFPKWPPFLLRWVNFCAIANALYFADLPL